MTIQKFKQNVTAKELAFWAGTCINILRDEPEVMPFLAGVVTNVIGDYPKVTIEEFLRHQGDHEDVIKSLGIISRELSVIILNGGTSDDETVLRVNGYLTRLYASLLELA
jgi:hypothetical protein